MMPPSSATIMEYWARPTASRPGPRREPRPGRRPAPGPSIQSSPMCDRSKSPARSRTARCSSRMPAYWTGISQPPKSMSRAPGVDVATVEGRSAHPGGPSRPADSGSRPDREVALDGGRRVGHDAPLGFVAHQLVRLGQVDPAHLVELVVVPLERAAGRRHEEVVDDLVDARARLHEPVLDVADALEDGDLQAGLLGHLAERRLLGPLARVGRALGQRPGGRVALAAAPTKHDLASSAVDADDDAAGRGRPGRAPRGPGGSAQSRHAAVGVTPARRAGGRGACPGHPFATAGVGEQAPLDGVRDGATGAEAERPRARLAGRRRGGHQAAARRLGQAVVADPMVAGRRHEVRLEPAATDGGDAALHGPHGSGSRPPCLRDRARSSRCRRHRAGRPSPGPSTRRREPRATARAISRRAAATYSPAAPGASSAIARRCARSVPDVAAHDGAGEGDIDAEALGVDAGSGG